MAKTPKTKKKTAVSKGKTAKAKPKTVKKKAVSKASAKKSSHTNVLRTPIVAVMGHVDHGKTTLLDTIRGANVAAGEAGGITQNTRAHKVNIRERLNLDHDQNITFIDTPGHEAFSEMRSRGARVADMVILVVAADDGVQPQTKESIKFIKKAGVPVIVACNKIDAPGANIEKIKQELSSSNILIEEYGGEAILSPVSALNDEGIEDLLENIMLVAEVNELTTEKPLQGQAEGFVLESNLNTDLGPVALVIIKSGQISRNQHTVSADDIHKVRATLDEAQKKTETTEQGDPAWVIGLNKVLPVGETLIFFDNQKEAEQLLNKMEEKVKADAIVAEAEAQEDTDIFSQLVSQKNERDDTETTLKVIVRTDTQGTLEAVTNKLERLKFDEARVVVFSAETGNVNETDVTMAYDVKGIILAFQVKVSKKAKTLAREQKVLLRTYELIYEMLNEVEEVVNSMIAPEEEIEEVATATVKLPFTLTNGKHVAGSKVIDGKVIRGYKAYVERDGEEIADGKIVSLKYLKEDIKEAKKGSECGIIIEPEVEYQEGDKIVCYKVVK